MKCEIYLYEKGRSKKWKLDIPENIQLNITYSFSDLTSPTTIADNYSKTITLPGTANNNKIFGYIYKFEREITNAYDILGFNYNPSKRVSYDLVVNDILYQTGWMKLNKITQKLGDIQYDITLYGDISNFLYKLSNGDVDDSSNKLLYSLSFPNNLSHMINKDTLKSFIDNSNSLSGWMTYIRANNGLYDEFESSKHLTKDSSGNYVVTDILGGLEFDELQKRECRSYYQRPALSVKGIFDRIKHDETEFQLNLDESFFKDSNPYYSKSYMTLPLLSTYNNEATFDGSIAQANIPINTNTVLNISSDTSIVYNNYVNADYLDGNKQISVEFEVSFDVKLPDEPTNLKYGYYMFFDSDYQPTLKVYYKTRNNTYEFEPFKEICETLNPQVVPETYTSGYAMFMPAYTNQGYSKFQLGTHYTKFYKKVDAIPVKFSIDLLKYNIVDEDGQIEVHITFPSKVAAKAGSVAHYTNATFSNVKIRPITQPDGTSNDLNEFYPASAGFTGKSLSVNVEQTLRSGYEVNKDLLLDMETTQSQFLIDYCKLFGLIFDTDKKGNLTLKTRNKYFEDYQILDWSNKLDYNQPIETNPLSFDTRYLTFKYNNSDGKYEDLYHNKYGIDYAELKINTGYQFNNDSKSIFDGIFNNTVMSKETDRFLIDGALLVERNSDIVVPAYFSRGEVNREAINTRFNLLFDNGLVSLNGNDNYYITDDSSYMLIEDNGGGEYCWLDCTKVTDLNITTSMNYYRQFSTLYNEGNTICSFDIRRPRENYANWNSVSYPNNVDIYSQFWQNYLNEIYNVNTKEISAYFKLSFNDMNTFSFKNFIVIGDALFHPIKIENYNPLANSTTKVTLVKVNDINNYIAGQIVPEITVNYFNVTQSFAYYCTLDMPSQVAEGGTFVCNIRKKDPLGHIVVDGCELSMGGITLNAADYIDTETETVTIPNVSGNIIIGISCSTLQAGGDGGGTDPDGPTIGPEYPGENPSLPDEPTPITYSVTTNKNENCTLTYNSSVNEGETFTCTVAINGEGSLSTSKSSITMGGNTISISDIYDSSSGTITITNVTGDIVMSIVCDLIIRYNVTLDGVGCTLTGNSSVIQGEGYSLEFVGNEGTVFSSGECQITMGGAALSIDNYLSGSNALYIPNVVGDLYIKIVYNVKTYTITTNLVSCSISGPTTINHGLDYKGTITPYTDYEVDLNNTVIKKGNTVLSNNYINGNKINIPYVDDNLTLNITCAYKYWNVDTIGSRCSVSGPSKVLKGNSYTGTITIDAGYELKLDDCFIMMGKNQLNVADYITGNTIYIPSVTGDLSISIICVESIVYYSVTNSFAYYCTLDYPTTVKKGDTFTCTITKEDSLGSIRPSDSEIIMGDTTLNAADYINTETGILTIPNVTGNITFGISCSKIQFPGGGDRPPIIIDPSIGGDSSSFVDSTFVISGNTHSTDTSLYQLGTTTNPTDISNTTMLTRHYPSKAEIDSSNFTVRLTIPAAYMETLYNQSNAYPVVVYNNTEYWYAMLRTTDRDKIGNGESIELLMLRFLPLEEKTDV